MTLDNEKPSTTELTWKWYLGSSEIPMCRWDSAPSGIVGIYSHAPTDRGSLRAEASYTKTDGSAKTVSDDGQCPGGA